MQLGTYLLRGELPVEDRLRITKEAGFDFVCIGTDAAGPTPEMCERIGFRVDNIHLTGNKTTYIWNRGDEGDAVTERYCREIEEFAARGVKTGIVHTTWGLKVQPEEPSDVGYSRFARIFECAAKNDFTVAVENSVFPGHVFAVLDYFKEECVKHCFDCGHRNAFSPDINYEEKYGDRMVATHLHDNDGAHDMHIMPFDGTVDWDEIAGILASTPVGRSKICSESGAAKKILFPEKSADELRRDFECLAMSGTDEIRYYDGYISVYENLTYEQLVERLYLRMKKLGEMVEGKNK